MGLQDFICGMAILASRKFYYEPENKGSITYYFFTNYSYG